MSKPPNGPMPPRAAMLERRKHEARQGERGRRQALDRARRRQAGAARDARHANQAPILLGLARSRSEVSAGRRLRAGCRSRCAPRCRPSGGGGGSAGHAGRAVAAVAGSAPPRGRVRRRRPAARAACRPRIRPADRAGPAHRRDRPQRQWQVHLAERAGRAIAARRRTCTRIAPCAWLDQRLADLDGTQCALDILADANPALPEAERHLRLLQLGLPREALLVPVAGLSGGERLKVALARAMHAREPAEWLLLDEPFNHLDLPSQQALEAMLARYPGALVVVATMPRCCGSCIPPTSWTWRPWCCAWSRGEGRWRARTGKACRDGRPAAPARPLAAASP
jgi:hypothetical protein